MVQGSSWRFAGAFALALMAAQPSQAAEIATYAIVFVDPEPAQFIEMVDLATIQRRPDGSVSAQSITIYAPSIEVSHVVSDLSVDCNRRTSSVALEWDYAPDGRRTNLPGYDLGVVDPDGGNVRAAEFNFLCFSNTAWAAEPQSNPTWRLVKAPRSAIVRHVRRLYSKESVAPAAIAEMTPKNQ